LPNSSGNASPFSNSGSGRATDTPTGMSQLGGKLPKAVGQLPSTSVSFVVPTSRKVSAHFATFLDDDLWSPW
jgi:hypothetical protein